jgi:predicted component of type VI protein secretion system
MLRVYLGWRFKAKITLTTRTRLLAAPPLGEGPFWLGMNGVLGAEEEGSRTISRRPLRRTGLLHRAGARDTTTRKPTCYVQV